jgi:hypothetical protein
VVRCLLASPIPYTMPWRTLTMTCLRARTSEVPVVESDVEALTEIQFPDRNRERRARRDSPQAAALGARSAGTTSYAPMSQPDTAPSQCGLSAASCDLIGVGAGPEDSRTGSQCPAR